MKKFNMICLLLGLLLCGLVSYEAQADRGGKYAAVGLGSFAAGALLGGALGSRPVYYDDYPYDYYGPYPYNAPYYYDDYGYRPSREYRHDYYWSPDGAPYRPKN